MDQEVAHFCTCEAKNNPGMKHDPTCLWRMGAVGREPILVEREHTHGDFRLTAEIAQALKNVIWNLGGKPNLCDAHREALDMIATKIARILAGNPNEKDHWNDIAGYAKLGAEACK